MSLGGFELWKNALVLDKQASLGESKSKFEAAAKAFFDEASGLKVGVARALYEYSTLMDAFVAVQDGRLLKEQSKFDEALSSFARAAEVLRSTVHFAFMASYASGCASLETAPELNDDDAKFEGYKNSVALFEQSKLALSFRDDHHPLIRSIDSMVKFTISRALLLESQMLAKKGSLSESRKKSDQLRSVEEEFRKLEDFKKESQITRFRIDYFLKGYDCERALAGSYILSYPEQNSLWMGNIGIHAALVETLGKSNIMKEIPPRESISSPLEPNFRGRLRISYLDEESHRAYDEGCLTVI